MPAKRRRADAEEEAPAAKRQCVPKEKSSWEKAMPYFLCGYSPKELPGREQQLAFMNDHATREGSVVFLHGTPGTGKTALVSRVAEKHFLKSRTLVLTCTSLRSTRAMLDQFQAWLADDGCERFASLPEQWEEILDCLIPQRRKDRRRLQAEEKKRKKQEARARKDAEEQWRKLTHAGLAKELKKRGLKKVPPKSKDRIDLLIAWEAAKESSDKVESTASDASEEEDEASVGESEGEGKSKSESEGEEGEESDESDESEGSSASSCWDTMTTQQLACSLQKRGLDVERLKAARLKTLQQWKADGCSTARQRRCLVLDELDFLMSGPHTNTRLQPDNRRVFDEKSTCIQFLEHLVEELMKRDNTVFLAAISNAETATKGPIAKIPQENRIHFQPYVESEMTEIVRSRIHEAGSNWEALFQEPAVRLLVLKSLKSGSGDCRTLLEHVRLSIAGKVGTNTSDTITPKDAAHSAPRQNEMYLWLRAMSDNARLFVVSCLALRGDPSKKITLAMVSAMYRKIHLQFMTAAHDSSIELMQVLLTEVSMHSFINPASVKPARGKRAASSTSDVGSRVVEVNSSLAPDMFYAALRTLHTENKGVGDSLLCEILEALLPSQDLF